MCFCRKTNSSKDLFSCMTYTFHPQYNTDSIANTKIVLDTSNSVIKRLWCIWSYEANKMSIIWVWYIKGSKFR